MSAVGAGKVGGKKTGVAKMKKEKRSKGGKDGKRRKRRTETFSLYIYKVLRQVHPETGISKKTMNIMNSFINDIFDRICTEAVRLIRYSKKKTLRAREIKTSVVLILPGELSRHARDEGDKAVNKYISSQV